MIEYDYVLERDEGDEIRKFTPNEEIGKKLPNLVLIEGPNSSGKSTLLNLIAAGFYGLKNSENIVSTLIGDMKHLIHSEKHKLKFQIKMDTPDGILVSEKKIEGDEPIVYLLKDGAKFPISPENFNKKYRLIYDIPDKPRDRIKNVLNELNNLYVYMGTALSEFRNYVEKVLEDIYRSQDPVMIERLKKRIEEYKERIKEDKEKYEGQKALFDDLCKYHAVKFFIEYYMIKEEIEQHINDIKKEKKKSKRRIKEYENLLGNLKEAIGNIVESEKIIINNINNLGYPDLIREIPDIEKSILNVTKNFPNENNRTLTILRLNYLKDKVNEILKEREKILQGEIIEIKIIKKLIEVLREFSSYDVELPGTDMSIKQYIKNLEEEYSRKKLIQEEYEMLEKIVREIDNIEYILEKTIPTFVKNLKKLGITKDDLCRETNENGDSLEDLERELKDIEKKLDKYALRCIEFGFGEGNEINISQIISLKKKFEEEEYIKDYMSLDEPSFENKLRDLKKTMERKLEDIAKFKALLEKEEEELNKIKSLPTHKYQPDRENIKKLSNLIFRIERNFKVKFLEYNNRFKQPINLINLEDDKFIKYHELVGKYLGKKLQKVKYIDGEYDVEKVDMLNDLIYLKSGKIISIKDIGTGHTQAAYIMSVLNKDDPRKIIALFDEISHMDSNTLAPIVERIRELYSRGKLVSCIMVQRRHNEVVVIDLEKGI